VKKILVITLLFFITSLLFAQSGQFTTVATKSTKVKKIGSSYFIELNVGEKLNPSDVIVCEKGGSTSFLVSTGKVLVYNKSKEIELSELLSVSSGGSNKDLAGKLQSIADSKLSPASKVSANIGGVRATESVAKDIFIITPRRGTKILDGYPVFNWNRMQGEDEYQLTILTEEFDVVKLLVLSDTTYQYSKDDPELEQGVTYICIVKPINVIKQSEYQTFTIATNEEMIEMKKVIDEINLLLSQSEADILTMSILLGATYESLELYSLAYQEYVTAISLSPNERAYRKMLADLLVKVNLIKEANYISGYNPDGD
jgi:cellobiose-specific phosphotransferase system component IIB